MFCARKPGKCSKALGLLLIGILPWALFSQDTSGNYEFRTRTDLVLVNVTARDQNGNLVRDLKRDDFTVLEDNKPQQIVSFDLENTDAVLPYTSVESPLLKAIQPPGGSNAEPIT